MKTTSYLYGLNNKPLDIPQDVINNRIKLLNDNLNKILKHNYLERDTKRMNDVLKAIEFWNSINYK